MKIAIIRSKGSIAPFVMDGFARAARQGGQPCLVVDVTAGFTADHLDQIKRFEPELVLAYNFSGYIKVRDAYLFRLLKIPLAALHYDNPFYLLNAAYKEELRQYPEFYYHFIWDDYYLTIYREQGYVNGFPIMLATDPEWFYPQAVQTRPDALAFVGSIYSGSAGGQLSPASLQSFVDLVLDLKLKHPAVPLLDICRETMVLPGFALVQQLYRAENEAFWKLHYRLHKVGSPLYRQKMMQNLSPRAIHLYGGSGDGWPESVTAHDPVPYGPELSRVYQQYPVHLNFSSLQLETSVNNRVFDVFAGKGLVLSDYKPDLERIFPEHWREISFKTVAELRTKADYYLDHPRQRQALTEELYRQVLAKHTYRRRLDEIINTFKEQRYGTTNSRHHHSG